MVDLKKKYMLFFVLPHSKNKRAGISKYLFTSFSTLCFIHTLNLFRLFLIFEKNINAFNDIIHFLIIRIRCNVKLCYIMQWSRTFGICKKNMEKIVKSIFQILIIAKLLHTFNIQVSTSVHKLFG